MKPKPIYKRISAFLLCFALLVGLLPTSALAAETRSTVGAFEVTGDSSNYSYSNGVLTVQNGADITISMASGATTPASDRIAVAANATATITLNNVNITPTDAQSEDGNSGIDLGSGATLNITLQSGSSNVINGGTSAAAMPAPGIHVPENSTLTIGGDGSLEVKGASGNSRAAVGIGGMGSDSENGEVCGNVIILGGTITVHGGTATTSSSPVDIGGGATDTGKGGDCNTVIILTSVNSGEGLTIGGGKGLSSNDGSDGAGIKPSGDGTYTVYGDLELPCDITIPQGATVTIPDGASLTVPKNVTLTNNGTITGSGSVTVSGDVSGNGSMSVTGTVTKKNQTAPDAPSSTTNVTDTSVTLSAVTDSGGIGGIEYGYTTGTETEPDHWQKSNTFTNLAVATSYTFYARYAGNDYYEPSSASSGLTVTTNKSDTELGNLTVSGQTGFEGHFQYGDTITVTFTPERKENNSTNALAENTATLTYTPDSGETVTLATATAQSGGSFELTYDTKEKKLPIGENLPLTVSYGGSGALNPVEETVTLSLDKAHLKNMPTVTGSFVYGGTLTLNYTPQDDEEVTYQWWRIIDDSSTERIDGATGETYTLTESEIGGGIYVIVSATDEWHRGAKQSDQYKISKAPGSIEIACDSVTYGTAVAPSVTSTTNEGATVTYTYTGVNGTDYPASTTAPTDAGTYTVTVAETATHTAATSDPVTFTIEGPPAPPANPNYRVDIPTPEHGTITANPAAAKAGTEVTLTITPEEGYEVGEVTVTDRFGDAVEVTENADGTYTFTMPNGQVKVEVTFVEMEAEPLPFTDVSEGDWFHDAVRYAYENGLMDGVGDGQFAPNATTNRAMVVTILYRLAGEPDVSGDVGFTDVAPGLWYTNAVTWAAEKGIVNGISATEFAPSGDLSREQLATVLYRYAEGMGYDVSASADLSGFPDADQIQSYATQALSWAVAEGLLQGFEDDSLQPQSTATRAQIATILMRFCETVAK